MKRSECTPQKLRDIGFKEIEFDQEPNIKDVAYYLQEGFYDAKVELDESVTYTSTDYEGPCYYQHKVTHYYHPEYLFIRCHDRKYNDPWNKVLVRNVEYNSYTDPYMGD